MSLQEPEERRSGRRSRDASPSQSQYARYEERDSRDRYEERPNGRDNGRREYAYGDEPRYARAEKTSELPYASKKTASFAMPGVFDDDDRSVRYEKKREEDPLAYGDKRNSKYDNAKFEEPSKKYYDDGPPRRESKKYSEDEPKRSSRHEAEPDRSRERSRVRESKQYYEDEPRKRDSKQYYEDYERKETRYEVSKPASKYESCPKPRHANPVYAKPVVIPGAPGYAAMMGANPKYDESDFDSDDSNSDGPTGDRRLDVEIDFKHKDEMEYGVRKRPSRRGKKYLEESSSALVTTTTTTSGARLDSQYDRHDRPSYDRPPSGRPVEVDYHRYESSSRPGFGSARTSETRITTINGKKEEASIVTAEPGHRKRASMGATLGATLAVGGLAAGSLSQAPGSPLLEAYRGTYQSMGAMPSPLMMPSAGFSSSEVAILDLNRASSPSVRDRRARFHDLTADATALREALRDRGKKYAVPTQPFIDVLPPLSHDQIMELRTEYKKQVKTPDHKGVNVAKHIKVRLKEDKSFLKACYATALGRYESEGYWANSYYQGSQTSRELLIEALMGRSNEEIRNIKAVFRDKKYSDDLVKCMKMELKEDKFKRAVLKVLEERRMEEPSRQWPVDRYVVDKDVRELYKALKQERGGETVMIEICIMRSEAHMREVLRVYESTYRTNFAREMLRKSTNLVVSHFPAPIVILNFKADSFLGRNASPHPKRHH